MCNRFTSANNNGLTVNQACPNIPLINYFSGHSNDVISNLAFYWNEKTDLPDLGISCQIDCVTETQNTFKKLNGGKLECKGKSIVFFTNSFPFFLQIKSKVQSIC